MNILDKINQDKWALVTALRQKTPLQEMKLLASEAKPPRGFINHLRQTYRAGNMPLIAEIKRASPSKGLIREDFDPIALAKAYQSGGASCLSVLTDQPYFQGKNEYLKQAQTAVSLPVLRKDFMLDIWQIYESRALGADCILLILAALDDHKLLELESCAHDLGMDVLLEVHNEEEMMRALKCASPMIGINNRNLKTLEVDLSHSQALLNYLGDHHVAVVESGLKTHQDLQYFRELGAKAYLIGESLMRQKDVETATKAILTGENAIGARS